MDRPYDAKEVLLQACRVAPSCTTFLGLGIACFRQGEIDQVPPPAPRLRRQKRVAQGGEGAASPLSAPPPPPRPAPPRPLARPPRAACRRARRHRPARTRGAGAGGLGGGESARPAVA